MSSRRGAAGAAEEEDPELIANKSSLFGNRTAKTTSSAAAPQAAAAKTERKETDEEEATRAEAEHKQSLLDLAADLHGSALDGDGAAELDALVEGGADGGLELDLTTSDIDFDGVDSDLARFQQDPLVMEALRAGVDLRAYSKGIEADLAALEQQCVNDCQ